MIDTFEYTGQLTESQSYYNNCWVRFTSNWDKQGKGEFSYRLYKLGKSITPIEYKYLNTCYLIHKLGSTTLSLEDDKLAVILEVTPRYVRDIRTSLKRKGVFMRDVAKVNRSGTIIINYLFSL